MTAEVEETAPHKCNRCKRQVLLHWTENEGDFKVHGRWKCAMCGASEHVVFDYDEFPNVTPGPRRKQ
jgi:DNA-directed RNA polymerase subunit RPC12/RpoP